MSSSSYWSPGPVVVAGPCALPGEALTLDIAHHLAEVAGRLGVRILFKASFDKANRAQPGAPRGPGLDAGLRIFETLRREVSLPLVTDVHETSQVSRVAEAVDVLQIPAFLCRQTDLLEAAGRTGRPVNIKKGQWMPPQAMAGAVAKVRSAGGDAVVTERGSFFGYDDLVVDMRNFERMRSIARVPVLFDATHSVQRPGLGPDGSSGGDRDAIPALMAAAAAAGADGFYIETHPEPEIALSDSATMWPLADFAGLVEHALGVWEATQKGVAPCWMR